MTLPEGTFLSAMSYASEGVPGTSQGSYVTVSEHHGIGYELADGTVMFQFAECLNWSVAHPSHAMAYPGQPDTRPEAAVGDWISGMTPFGFGGGSGAYSQELVYPHQFAAFETETEIGWTPEPLIPYIDPPPLPTPLPGAALFLLSAVIALWVFVRKSA